MLKFFHENAKCCIQNVNILTSVLKILTQDVAISPYGRYENSTWKILNILIEVDQNQFIIDFFRTLCSDKYSKSYCVVDMNILKD